MVTKIKMADGMATAGTCAATTPASENNAPLSSRSFELDGRLGTPAPAEQLAALLCSEAGSATPPSLDQLRELVFHGACEGSGVHSRPLAWRILLGVLDVDSAHWNDQLAVKRRQYQDWKREFLGRGRQRCDASREAHLSSPERSGISHKADYEHDVALLKEIDKSALPLFAVGSVAQQWMMHVLFVYAKLHPELGYIQGMNEILAPIVFVFAIDQRDEMAIHAEADTFFSFSAVMASVAPLYAKSPSDPTKSGVDTQMTRLTLLLRQHDAPLWQHLNSVGLTPDLYSFRWYMTLLTREFSMATTLRIWDALLADPKRFSFLHYASCALIRSQRAVVLQSGFAGSLKALQSLPDVDIERVLALAEQMREKDRTADQRRCSSSSNMGS